MIKDFNKILLSLPASKEKERLVDIYCMIQGCNSISNWNDKENKDKLQWRLSTIHQLIESIQR